MDIHEFQNKRHRPKKYIDNAIQWLEKIKGNVIVEIGSMRQSIGHDIDNESFPCCNDGHSSVIFARTGKNFYTIDIDRGATSTTTDAINKHGFINNTTILNGDGITFLKTFKETYNRTIDLLFLDAWDVGLPDSAEKHLEAFVVSRPSLSTEHLILIDDTDVDFINGVWKNIDNNEGGKGRLLVPFLKDNGYELLLGGRQTLLKSPSS